MSEQSDELTMWEVAGLLRLPVKGARNWVKRHCPREGVRREGRQLYLALWGLNAGLAHCVWQPRSPTVCGSLVVPRATRAVQAESRSTYIAETILVASLPTDRAHDYRGEKASPTPPDDVI